MESLPSVDGMVIVNQDSRRTQKQPWTSPEIVPVGTIAEITAGATGPFIEYGPAGPNNQITQPNSNQAVPDADIENP